MEFDDLMLCDYGFRAPLLPFHLDFLGHSMKVLTDIREASATQVETVTQTTVKTHVIYNSERISSDFKPPNFSELLQIMLQFCHL